MADNEQVPIVQRVARIFGWAFIAVGVGGFLVTGASMETHPDLAPKLLGLFPLNVLHNVVHLVLGVFGIVAAKQFTAAKLYCRITGIVYLLLAGLGAMSPDMFGLVPIGGADVWLHLVFALPLILVGFTAGRKSEPAPAAPPDVGRS
jgi:uncharacterized protein DUF4383